MITSLKSWINSLTSIITPHYLHKRLKMHFVYGAVKKMYWEIHDKNKPWLTHESLKIINDLIRPTDTILEFGSGQSTLWFCQKAKKVISIEHDRNWYQKTKQSTKNYPSLKLFLKKTKKEYLDILNQIPDRSIDVCLVDGQWRPDCILKSINKIKEGGFLVLDNAETIIPVSWTSISYQDTWSENQQPEKSKTLKIISHLKKWRFISTSDISQDTVIFVKSS